MDTNKDAERDIERIEENWRKGYRVVQDERYAFYSVYWLKIAGHYVIQRECRSRQYNRKFSPYSIQGPFIEEILELDAGEDAVDRRCLDIIRQKFPKTKRIVREVVREIVAELE